jgi:hypothetical protein
MTKIFIPARFRHNIFESLINRQEAGTEIPDRPERGFRTDRNGASGPTGTGLPDRPEPSQGTPKSRHLQ